MKPEAVRFASKWPVIMNLAPPLKRNRLR